MPWGFCLVSSEVELLWQTIGGIKVFDTTVPFCVRTENQSKEASNSDALLTLVTVLHLDVDLSCDLMECHRNLPVFAPWHPFSQDRDMLLSQQAD